MAMRGMLPALLLIFAVFRSGAASDTANLVMWAMLREKPTGAMPSLPKRTLDRRAGAGFAGESIGDIPPDRMVVEAIGATGAVIRHSSAWLNAVSFSGSPQVVRAVAELRGVKGLRPVAQYSRQRGQGAQPVYKSRVTATDSWYGESYAQLEQIGVPDAQRALRYTKAQNPGNGVLIAFFDSGFLLEHSCLTRAAQRIENDSDFVDNDGDVGNADALGGSHGAVTLSLVAGYDPGRFMGVAWDARFVLARTENDFSERHSEEDNWIAALEWAERLGVHIINSSLGYRFDFDPPDESYPFALMDGESTLISMAADSATRRGVLIVNSMGNDGQQHGDSSINAPADARGVIAVGAVDFSGYLASFSSRGPTADGRMKPDVVAPGQSVVIPQIGSRSSYTRGSGTSYSAPLVSGACALIMQMQPHSDSVRTRLFASCRPAPGQMQPDNSFGFGIVDALFGVIGPQIYVRALGGGGESLANAIVKGGSSAPARTDSAGVVVLSLDTAVLPVELEVALDAQTKKSVAIDTIPARIPVVFTNRARVSVQGEQGQGVAGAIVRWKSSGSHDWQSGSVEPGIVLLLPHYSAEAIMLTVCAPGYRCSDTIKVDMEPDPVTCAVTLVPLSHATLSLFPTVIRLSHPRPAITIQFVASADQESVTIGVRSSGGALVWERSLRPSQNQTVNVSIPCDSRVGLPWAPGTYLVTIRYGHEVVVRKVFVVG